MKYKALATSLAIFTITFTAWADNLRERSIDFLYRNMPAADSANYPRTFFEKNVEMSLKAKAEMPWGNKVPEREFLHFVVPVRVNNEALDNHREVFYNELKDRVKGLSMKDAILEINHWCHEKVNYQPSDSRTHSPLQSVSSAIGRCGEESTFGVAALRAMGIPARQVYTPRWAHTDDNHAWVEAWADGKWYFLGACEPEPVLNLGWFNSPASRGMLMHARVFGPYTGKEEILSTADGITDINVTSNYAPVDTITVRVVDAAGLPVKGADVDFRIYNYAEFYPLASKTTDARGETSLITGLGDILVWATDGNNYNFQKVHTGNDRLITLQILPDNTLSAVHDFDIVPPKAQSKTVAVTTEQRAENDRRFAQEDSIRMAYIASFVKAVDGDSISELLSKARGNHKVISDFLADKKYSPKAFSLLRSLSEKDLTDVTAEVLDDHYTATDNGSPLFARYIMSPRIASEPLTAFRSYFRKAIPAKQQKRYLASPQTLVEEIANTVSANEYWYPVSVTMNPTEVHKTGKTSRLSRDIYFVAVARSIGIPARINPVTGKPQWADNTGNWRDAQFDAPTKTSNVPQRQLTLTYKPNKTVSDPLYYTHFTISRIENGKPHLLEFPEFAPLSGEFSKGVTLDEGTYMITSGQRLADGGVLAHVEFFELKDSDTTLPLTLRSDSTQVQVIGSFNSELKFTPEGAQEAQSVLATTGRGYFVIGFIKAGNEPSNHLLRDLAVIKAELEKEGTPIVLIAEKPDDISKIDGDILKSLPSTATVGYDSNGSILPALAEATKSEEMPAIIIADTFNRVVFASSGYNIGLGTKLLDILRRIK